MLPGRVFFVFTLFNRAQCCYHRKILLSLTKSVLMLSAQYDGCFSIRQYQCPIDTQTPLSSFASFAMTKFLNHLILERFLLLYAPRKNTNMKGLSQHILKTVHRTYMSVTKFSHCSASSNRQKVRTLWPDFWLLLDCVSHLWTPQGNEKLAHTSHYTIHLKSAIAILFSHYQASSFLQMRLASPLTTSPRPFFSYIVHGLFSSPYRWEQKKTSIILHMSNIPKRVTMSVLPFFPRLVVRTFKDKKLICNVLIPLNLTLHSQSLHFCPFVQTIAVTTSQISHISKKANMSTLYFLIDASSQS